MFYKILYIFRDVEGKMNLPHQKEISEEVGKEGICFLLNSTFIRSTGMEEELCGLCW